jgi:hypothetical protein
MTACHNVDTLLTRRCVTATPLFRQIECALNIPNFPSRRIEADDGRSTLEQIYRNLSLPSAVMQLELALECDNAIAINQNLHRVEHGDVLINNSPIQAANMLRMLRRAGLDKQVTIVRSDPGNRATGSTPTQIESILIDLGIPHLAYLIRQIRLSLIDASAFSGVACQLNLPWLFISAELLRRRHSQNLTFLGRDGQLLSILYDAYFGPAHYLPFSRRVAYAQPETAVAYLKAHSPDASVFIDISSTGATWAKLQSGIRIEALIYCDLDFYTPERPNLPQGFSFLTRTSLCGQTNALLEVFNCGDHGYLSAVEINPGGWMRAEFEPLRVDSALVQEIHTPARLAANLAPIYRAPLLNELGRVPTDQLMTLFGVFCREICAKALLSHDERLKPYFRDELTYKAFLQQAAGDPAPHLRDASTQERIRAA